MDVCPKCHNMIVYGMNCCTGKRVLNELRELPPPGNDPAYKEWHAPCPSCNAAGDQPHEPWRHKMADRIKELEDEVAAIKKNGFKPT